MLRLHKFRIRQTSGIKSNCTKFNCTKSKHEKRNVCTYKPHIELYKVADSIIDDTYLPEQKVVNLVKTYGEFTGFIQAGQRLDITSLMNWCEINSYDFLRKIYVHLHNKQLQTSGKVDTYSESQFNLDFGIKRLLDEVFLLTHHVDTFHGFKMDIHLRKPKNFFQLQNLSTPHQYGGERQFISLDVFDKYNGPNAMHEILMRIVYDKMKAQATGHHSICNESTIKQLQKVANVFITKHAQLFGKQSGPGIDRFGKYVKLPLNLASILAEELISNSTFTSNDKYIEIGKLMDKFGIESYQLLYAMYHIAQPLRICMYNQCTPLVNFTFNEAQDVIETKNGVVKYYNGRPIHQTFRKEARQSQYIHVTTFDDMTYQGAFYLALFTCMWNEMNR